MQSTRPPRLLRAAAALVGTALVVGGCAGAQTPTARVGPGVDAATAGIPSLAPAREAPSSPPSQPADDEPDRSPGFGQTFRYGGGLVVRVDSPERFRPSAWVQREPGVALRFQVTVRNRTGEEWNPSQLHVRLASAFSPATQIFDYDNQVVARPEDRLPPGRTATFAVGYWAPHTDRLTLEFSPGFGYEAVTVNG